MMLSFNFQMLKEIVLISFIKPDLRKTLNIINLWDVDNITITVNYKLTVISLFKGCALINQRLTISIALSLIFAVYHFKDFESLAL